MIERFRVWLREWLLLEAKRHIDAQEKSIEIQQKQIAELRAEVTRLSIARYTPPETPEPKKKVIQTRNMREYNAILEREQEHQFEEA